MNRITDYYNKNRDRRGRFASRGGGGGGAAGAAPAKEGKASGWKKAGKIAAIAGGIGAGAVAAALGIKYRSQIGAAGKAAFGAAKSKMGAAAQTARSMAQRARSAAAGVDVKGGVSKLKESAKARLGQATALGSEAVRKGREAASRMKQKAFNAWEKGRAGASSMVGRARVAGESAIGRAKTAGQEAAGRAKAFGAGAAAAGKDLYKRGRVIAKARAKAGRKIAKLMIKKAGTEGRALGAGVTGAFRAWRRASSPAANEEDIMVNAVTDEEVEAFIESDFFGDAEINDMADYFDSLTDEERSEFETELAADSADIQTDEEAGDAVAADLGAIEYAMNRWGFEVNEDGSFVKENPNTDTGHYLDVNPDSSWQYSLRRGEEVETVDGAGFDELREVLGETQASVISSLRRDVAEGVGSTWAGYTEEDPGAVQLNEDEIVSVVNHLDALSDSEIHEIIMNSESAEESAENLGEAIAEAEAQTDGMSALAVDEGEFTDPEDQIEVDEEFDEDLDGEDEGLEDYDEFDDEDDDDDDIDLGANSRSRKRHVMKPMMDDEDLDVNGCGGKKKRKTISANSDLNNNSDGGSNNMADRKPCCPGKVEALIQSNRSPFEETDREWLLGLDEIQINKLVQTDALLTQADKKITPQVNEEVKKILSDPDKFMSFLPPELQEQLRSGMQLHREKRQRLMDAIIQANSRFTEENLKDRTMEGLEELVSLIPNKPDYSVYGAGNGTSPRRTGVDSKDLLLPPDVKIN